MEGENHLQEVASWYTEEDVWALSQMMEAKENTGQWGLTGEAWGKTKCPLPVGRGEGGRQKWEIGYEARQGSGQPGTFDPHRSMPKPGLATLAPRVCA